MEDCRKPGFILNLTFNNSCPLTYLSMWLSDYLGLKDKYLGNILSFSKTADQLSIIFVSESNCFEVIQRLKCEAFEFTKKYRSPPRHYLQQISMSYSGNIIKHLEVSKCGKKLRVIKVCPTGESELFDLKNIKQSLEKFGLILLIERQRDKGICTGYIYVLMVFYDEYAELCGDEKDISEVPYTLNCFDEFSKETTEELQKMFYGFVQNSASQNVKHDETISK